LSAYSDLFIIECTAHIAPTARSWTGALARKEGTDWRCLGKRRATLERPLKISGALAPAHSRLGWPRPPRHPRHGPSITTESLGRSPRDPARLSHWVVAGPMRRNEARFLRCRQSRGIAQVSASSRLRANTRCNWRALQALRLGAYLDLLMTDSISHIEATARSWTGALARKQGMEWRRGGEPRPPRQRPCSADVVCAPAHSHSGEPRSLCHARRGATTSTESLGCSPRERSRPNRWVVARPLRRIEAQSVSSSLSRCIARRRPPRGCALTCVAAAGREIQGSHCGWLPVQKYLSNRPATRRADRPQLNWGVSSLHTFAWGKAWRHRPAREST